MNSKVFSVIFLFVTAGTILLLSGCTLACTGLGALEDSKAPDIANTIPGWEAEKVKSGAQIIVNLKDATIVSGKYLGIDSIRNEKYAEKYAEIQKQMPEGSFLPSIGDTITVSSKLPIINKVIFENFEREYIVLSPLDRYAPVGVGLENIENITDNQGNKTEGETIRNLVSEGKIPSLFLLQIVVEEDKKEKDKWEEEEVSTVGKKFIDINDIEQIQIKSVKRGTQTGVLTGCIVDAIIGGTVVGLVFYAVSHWP